MIILAASVVISLSNTGVINKAGEATDKTNLKQVEQLAALTWSDGYMDKLRDQDLIDYVLEEMEDYTDAYDINVSNTGVTVNKKGEGTIEPFDYYTYEYDTTNMTATLTGVQEKYAVVGYYSTSDGTYTFAKSIVDDAGKKVTKVSIPSTVTGADGNTYTVTVIKGGALSPNIAGWYKSVSDDYAEYTEIVIPDTVVEIDDYAFGLCKNLTKITIPKSVTSIGWGAFFNCEASLKDIYYTGTEDEWTSIAKDRWYNDALTIATIHYNYVAK